MSQIEICHRGRTISIDDNAWVAHEAHGDYSGACGSEDLYNWLVGSYYKDSEILETKTMNGAIWLKLYKPTVDREKLKQIHTTICESEEKILLRTNN